VTAGGALERKVIGIAALGRAAGAEGILLFVLALYAMDFLIVGARGVYPDAWLGVVAGREIVQHGLPTVDHLTVLAAGRRWVDQQWLGQLVFYGLYKAGGMRLIVLVNAAVAGGAVSAAAILARKRGASLQSTVWIALVAFTVLFAVTPRPQTLVFPFFVVVVWLISADSRSPSSRIFWVLPLLVLWANVHGSVVLAAALVSLYGLLARGRSPRSRVVLVIAPWLCTLASPYAVHLPEYYRAIAFNPAFARYVTEWQATRLSALTAPFFVLAGASTYLLGRARGALSRGEMMLVLATEGAALLALRNVVWFAIVAIIVVPTSLDRVLRAREMSRRFNELMAAVGGALVLSALVLTLASSSVGTYPEAASRAVATAAGHDGRVFTSDPYGDWLLGMVPSLRGRVAFDSRFELLRRSTVDELVWLRAKAVDWPRFAREYRVFVLHPKTDDDLVGALERHGYGVGFRRSDLIVLARPRVRSAAAE
jgi:hypothetical protein